MHMIIQIGLFLGSYLLLIVICRLLMGQLEKMVEMKDKAQSNRSRSPSRKTAWKNSQAVKEGRGVMVHNKQSLP